MTTRAGSTDTRITDSKAARLISTCCRDVAIDSIQRLGEGDFFVAFLVNQSLVFRFAKNQKAAASLCREACLLPQIANRFDLRIPSPHFLQTSSAPAFVGYDFLPGPELSKARYDEVMEPNRELWASQVANFLRQLHTSEVEVALKCGVDLADYRGQYEWVIDRAREHLFRYIAETDSDFVEHTVSTYIESAERPEFTPALLHGDLSPDHVLYDRNAMIVTGIIDFSDMVIGDPASDLVLLYEDYGLDFFQRFLRHYEIGASTSLLRRMFRFHVLSAIEWAVKLAEDESPELQAGINQLVGLRAGREIELEKLIAACC